MVRTLSCIFILIALTAGASAQTTGNLCGKVFSAHGSPIRGATVKLLGTSPARGAISKEDGSFFIAGIRADEYDIQISAVGFRTQTRENVRISVNMNTLINIQLVNRQVSCDSVIVTASRGIIRPENSGKKSAISFDNGSPASSRTNIQGAVGVDGFSVRGGRASEVTVRTDGFRTSGGDILSGVVNSATRSSDYAEPENPQPFSFNSSGHGKLVENTFQDAGDNRFSTFGIDVDAAAYSMIRSYINARRMPPADAVRIEEMVNYFTYDYPQPTGDAPFSISTEVAECPWNRSHKLVHIGLQGKRIPMEHLPPNNLVFLIDVSGSMSSYDRLPLLKKAFGLLVDELRPQDRVAIVTYAGNAGLALASTSGKETERILEAIGALESGGTTAGGEGIQLAYDVAKENFLSDGNNRVILATDGDFNVGISSPTELEELIVQKRGEGIFLTVLGVGTHNYQDNRMETLADKGNGNYAYLDGLDEARRVLVGELGATLFTIAKDVKIQVEFNPLVVKSYRLIGYENRMLKREDFHDDTKDAGELGAGHSVTAMYEIELANAPYKAPETPSEKRDEQEQPLRPEQPERPTLGSISFNDLRIRPVSATADTLMFVKLRYKPPTDTTSRLLIGPLLDADWSIAEASERMRFSTAVAEFGLLLRNSSHKGDASFDNVIALAGDAIGTDQKGYRTAFIELVRQCPEIIEEEKERLKEIDATANTSSAGGAQIPHGLPCQ